MTADVGSGHLCTAADENCMKERGRLLSVGVGKKERTVGNKGKRTNKETTTTATKKQQQNKTIALL